MGARGWFIAYFDDDPKKTLANGQDIDRNASLLLAKTLFPNSNLEEEDDGVLGILDVDIGNVLVGCYPGLRVIAHDKLSGYCPSKIDPRWFDPALGRYAYLHATHSVVDWLAFALWENGKLIRSLSLSPDDGIIENIGDPLPFEQPYWDGKYPVSEDNDDPYPFPFHPLELSEVAMLHNVGFQFEGDPADWVCDPYEVPISSYNIKKQQSGWKFW